MSILAAGGAACGNNMHSGVFAYHSGYAFEADVPAAIAMGVLKYIAHSIENQGDLATVVSATSGSASNESKVSEANNPALASGAIEIWRTALPYAI